MIDIIVKKFTGVEICIIKKLGGVNEQNRRRVHLLCKGDLIYGGVLIDY